MMIIETCPECGGDLMDLVLTTYPPIPCKRCIKCGWYWEGTKPDIVRVPFNPKQGIGTLTDQFNDICEEVQNGRK